MQLLTAIVRPRGYLPDFLQPFPPRRAPSFEAGLAHIAASDPGLSRPNWRTSPSTASPSKDPGDRPGSSCSQG
jgi:hypothetical protein